MSKRKIISSLNIFLVITFLTLPIVGLAQFSPIQEVERGGSSGSGANVKSVADAKNPLVPCNDVDSCDWAAFGELLDKLKNYGLQIAVMLSVLFIVYAGWLYLTAGGNSGKISQAHNILQNVIIGFFLAAAGWLIINAITKTLEVDTNLLPGGFK